MSIKIVHARMDENGKTDGPLVGDQTGKEILEAPFYLNDSVYLLICKDTAMAERALNYALQIARDDSYGYSQGSVKRWTGLESIQANGGRVAGGSGSFDCASLMFSVYILAGLQIEPDGYTGNLLNKFKATGMFDVYQGAPYTASDAYARRGCLYLRPKTSERGGHVFMAAHDGSSAILVEDGSAEADQIDPPYVETLGNVNVRPTPDTSKKPIYTARRGEKLPFGDVDDDTGWYAVETPNGPGFITNKPKYTRLVIV